MVRAIADRKGVTPGQPALARSSPTKEEIVTLPGTKRVAAQEENGAAADVRLTDSEPAEPQESLPEVVGDRYELYWMATIDQ